MKNTPTHYAGFLAALFLVSGIAVSRGQSTVEATPASGINPPGSNTRIKWGNPGNTKNYEVIKGSAENLQPLTPEAFASTQDSVILDFEPASGFSTAELAVSSDGSVARGNSAIADARLFADQLSVIHPKVPWLHEVKVEWMAIDPKLKQLARVKTPPKAGALLVKDREGNDVVSSQKQGVIAIPLSTQKGELVGGTLFTADTDLGGFACVANNRITGYTILLLFLNENDEVLFSYLGGVGVGNMTYIGLKTNGMPFRKVWMGQLGGQDGTVFDDIGFLPAGK